MIGPEEAIERIQRRFGVHAGSRVLHAKGTVCRGTFTATPEAARLTRAPHMQGEPAEAMARVSNGGGDPNAPDYAPDVRGLAVGMTASGAERTDIVSQTAPRFPVKTPDAFVELVEASKPQASMALRLPLFLARNPFAVRALLANGSALAPPASYATVPYYAIHAFRMTDADGESRYVRYTWQPAAPEQRLSRSEAKRLGRDYLQQELAERLERGPVRFTLFGQIAAEGDEVDDPTSSWPGDRRVVRLGQLELSEQADEDPHLIFDPMRLIDGIEPSEDPILTFRPRAYSVSFEHRQA